MALGGRPCPSAATQGVFHTAIICAMASSEIDVSSSAEQEEDGAVDHTEDVSTTDSVVEPDADHGKDHGVATTALTKTRAADKPLTEETADSVMEDMMGVLKLVTRERNAYLEEREYFDELTAHTSTASTDADDVPMDEEQLLLEEAQLLDRLERARNGQSLLSKKMQGLMKLEEQLNELELRHGLCTNQYTASSSRGCDRLQSCRNKLDESKQRLLALKSVSVYNVAFFIWHDGPFGTINSFRLGRCPSILVEWSEVNCAWGQTTLLLATIAHKLSFTFLKYRLIPMGNVSKIAKTGRDRTTYDLNSTGSGRMFSRNTFGLGMVAFLHCLQEICQYITERDRSFLFPHAIDGEKIGGFSIKLQGVASDEWTHALKCMLSNLKWLLAWSVNHQFV